MKVLRRQNSCRMILNHSKEIKFKQLREIWIIKQMRFYVRQSIENKKAVFVLGKLNQQINLVQRMMKNKTQYLQYSNDNEFYYLFIMNQDEISNIKEPLIQLTLGQQSSPNYVSIYEFREISQIKSSSDIIEAAKKNQMAILNAAVESVNDIHQLVDQDKRTILHYLALNGNSYVFMRLIQKYPQNSGTWLQINDKFGLQAAHYAVYKQKLELFKEICKFYRPEKLQGFAAFNNDISMMVTIYEMNDNRYKEEVLAGKVTPLHLACYAKSDYAAILLMRWRCNINAQDENGDTPLHICARQDNSKIIRKIIQRGGSLHIQNKQGQLPLHLANQQTTIDALKSFRFTWKSLLLQLNIKPRKRSIAQTILFIVFYMIINGGTYTALIIEKQPDWIIIFFLVSAAISFILYLIAMLKDPGFANLGDLHNLPQLLQKSEPFEICYDCFLQLIPRSKHCEFCKRCVQVYDHHCPWINNCIGKNNLFIFLLFIVSLFFNFVFNFALGIFMICYKSQRILLKDILILEVVLEFLFLIPLISLILTQISNIRAGLTTYERLILEKPRNQKRTSFIQNIADLKSS